MLSCLRDSIFNVYLGRIEKQSDNRPAVGHLQTYRSDLLCEHL